MTKLTTAHRDGTCRCDVIECRAGHVGAEGGHCECGDTDPKCGCTITGDAECNGDCVEYTWRRSGMCAECGCSQPVTDEQRED